MDCKCTIPNGGWCERHKVHKGPHWVMLCQTRTEYFAAWEEGKMPGQRREQSKATPRPVKTPIGPGTELKKMLGCGCGHGSQKFVSSMNSWGPAGCEERLERVVKWICESRCKLHEPITPESAERVARIAICRARKAGIPADM